MKQSEEHWEVEAEEWRGELDSRRREGEEGRGERSERGVRRFFGGAAEAAGRPQLDRSSALRTFSMVHTLSSATLAPGKVSDSSSDPSSSMLDAVVASVPDESPSASASASLSLLRFALFPPAPSLPLLSARNDIDNNPIRCVATGTTCRGSLYVIVPEFQSLK